MSAKTTRYLGVPLSVHSVICRKITVAGGVFAPGHLGELTQLILFEMVDEALSATATVRPRIRDLQSRVVVYLLPAAALFEGQGYRQVWQRLYAGLGALAPNARRRRRCGRPRPTPDPTLRLVTCGGRFDPRLTDYTDNIIVFATLATS